MDSGTVGELALWGAVVAVAGTFGARRFRGGVEACSTAALALASVALGALAWSLLTSNFALTFVADTTTRHGSWPYRLAGLWGGNDGSLLLWAWIILVAGRWATPSRPLARLIATVIGGAALLVSAAAANPFQRLAIPAIDGGGLNPILYHPAMLYHPILLYAGHAGLVAPFALAVAGLASGRLDQAWLALVRRWVLVAWLLLGVGLVAGAHWAYAELGWGGFWGWDPVENSGLVPWLAATAFLHRARAEGHASHLRNPTGLAALAALPFCLSLLGATVSRSGAAQSVHAFAQAAAVGRGLLAILVVAVGAVLLLVVRAERARPQPVPVMARPVMVRPPQQAVLAGGVVILLAISVAVLVGTAFPTLVHAATGNTIAVATRYYATVVTPLAVIALVLMAAGPSLGPHREPIWRGAPTRWLVAAAGGLVAAVAFGRQTSGWPGGLAAAGLAAGAAFAAVLTAAELIQTRRLRRAGGLLAHLGLALLLVGVAGSLFGRQSTEVVRPGSGLTVSGLSVRYRDTIVDQGAGWQRVRVILDVSRGGRPVASLRPGLQVFDRQAAALSVVGMHSTPTQDLVVAVRAIDPASRAATLEVTVRPLVALVWVGGLVAAAGGTLVLLVAMAERRRREDDELATDGPKLVGTGAEERAPA